MKLFLITLALLTATSINTQARSIQPAQYEVITASLDKKIFDFENQIVLFNKNGDDVHLRILNDICPNRPGMPSCRAAAMIVFDAKFTLTAQVESADCNTKVQTSDVVSYDGKKAKITFSDLTQNTCDLVYVSDYRIDLKIKNEKGLKSTSIINVSDLKPRIQPMPPQIIEEFNMMEHSVKGPFFKDHVITGGELSLDQVKDLASLTLYNNPCAGRLCLAVRGDILRRDFKIVKTEAVVCNVTKITTETKSVYDAYPAVIGATITKAQLEIYDYRLSTCLASLRPAGLEVKVKITTEKDYFNYKVKGESSEAVFNMFKSSN